MRRIFLIGLGAGNPEHVTVQAIQALNQVDVFFVLDKGSSKAELVRARREICERYIGGRSYRFVELPDPVRDPNIACYRARVDAWHAQRAALYEQHILSELGEDDCGGFLVWGDPALYDSTLRVIEQVAARARVAFNYEIVPGISSVQALAAAHKIALNDIGGPVHITTGRRLAAEAPSLPENVVVMLDGEQAFTRVIADDVDIYWGAYLGSPDEILISGRLSERAEEIVRVRAAARAEKGWIMDTYLLRRRAP